MNRINTLAVTAALLSGTFADSVALCAADIRPMVVLKPVFGPGASSVSHKALLNEVVGKKQAISYFLNENELCKVTVMVGDAFNGADVTDAAAVRFQVALGDGARARLDTAEGNSLEFVCREHAQVLTVKLGRRQQNYPSGI